MRRVGALVPVAVLLVMAGCAGARPTTAAGAPTANADPARGGIADRVMPAQILDLTTAPEDIAKTLKKAGHDAYITGARLWSLRDGERLRATLEVARLAPDARPEDESFRARIANIGGAGTVRWVDGHEVYVRRGNQQSIYVWFSGIHFLILSVSAEYPAPRSLMRAALEVKP